MFLLYTRNTLPPQSVQKLTIMSKTILRKELKNMSREQLEQIIIDAYDARPEIKEYFEFFLNPDIDKLLEKYEKTVAKELRRVKWNTSKARVTVLKRAAKSFASVNPGYEAVNDMYFLTLTMLGVAERYVDFTPALFNYVAYVVAAILRDANEAMNVTAVVERLEGILSDPRFSEYFRRSVRAAIAEV